MLNKALAIFLICFIVITAWGLYSVDKCYFLCPIEYKLSIIIRNDTRGNGEFSARRSGGREHRGIDLYGKVGEKVRAVRFGRVKEAGFHKSLGNYVELSHAGEIVTIYGHLNRIFVKEREWVFQGDIIGWVGNTGNAVDPEILPHLHFEVRKNKVPINPLDLLEERSI